MSENEQIGSFGHADKVRQELTPKIDEKLSSSAFFVIFSTLIVVLIAVFSFNFNQMNKFGDRLQNLATEVAVLNSNIGKNS